MSGLSNSLTCVAQPQGTIYPLADKALDGSLATVLRDGRAEGRSYYDLRDQLRALGVPVSHETVRRWCQDLGIEKAEASA